MADPNPLAGMPFAESLAHQMNESLQWMSRMWGNPAAAGPAGGESVFARLPPMPAGLPSMLMPTFDPKELEKRINDLKTVEHWLDMNRALLHSTIQTLEMQRNAIVAMQSMAQAAPPSPSVAGAGQAASGVTSTANPHARGDAAPPPMPFDPAPWWNALQEQFARVAAAAAQPDAPAADPESQGESETARTPPAGERTGSPPAGASKPGRKGSGPSGSSG